MAFINHWGDRFTICRLIEKVVVIALVLKVQLFGNELVWILWKFSLSLSRKWKVGSVQWNRTLINWLWNPYSTINRRIYMAASVTSEDRRRVQYIFYDHVLNLFLRCKGGLKWMNPCDTCTYVIYAGTIIVELYEDLNQSKVLLRTQKHDLRSSVSLVTPVGFLLILMPLFWKCFIS